VIVLAAEKETLPNRTRSSAAILFIAFLLRPPKGGHLHSYISVKNDCNCAPILIPVRRPVKVKCASFSGNY